MQPLRLLYVGLSLGLSEPEAWLSTPGKIMQLWYYQRLYSGMLQKAQPLPEF